MASAWALWAGRNNQGWRAGFIVSHLFERFGLTYFASSALFAGVLGPTGDGSSRRLGGDAHRMAVPGEQPGRLPMKT